MENLHNLWNLIFLHINLVNFKLGVKIGQMKDHACKIYLQVSTLHGISYLYLESFCCHSNRQDTRNHCQQNLKNNVNGRNDHKENAL